MYFVQIFELKLHNGQTNLGEKKDETGLKSTSLSTEFLKHAIKF